MSPDTYLSLARITKLFGDFEALKDLTLEIQRGEFVCFLGPSGCGKTTLLRIIAGLEVQTSGSIVQDGVEISLLPPTKRDFGIVFQSYALFPNLTIRRNVAYGIESRGGSRQQTDARVKELLELVNLADQGNKYPAQLSGGQQQRVALARALAPSPGLLLLDEPLSALDASVRHYLRHEIRSLQKRLGVTTIMVTHDQEEALTMADRIVVMNQGTIEQIGTPHEIYGKPVTPFVAQFIGHMNLIECAAVGPGKLKVGEVALSHYAEDAPETGMSHAAIRPEDIVISDDHEAENQVDGQITTVEFRGQSYRLIVSAAAMNNLELTVDISAHNMRGRSLEEGDSIRLKLPAESLHVFDGRV